MGKLNPPRPQTLPPISPDPALFSAQPGPCQLQARELVERLRGVEEGLDLDELDRLARRHARPTASGAPEALEALAVVVQDAPELFQRTEVNLDPARLLELADRQRALTILATAVGRFHDLVQDSHMEQGDEVVELLTVGWGRIQGLQPERVSGSDRLAVALRVLEGYQERVISEKAHRVPAEEEPAKKPKKRK